MKDVLEHNLQSSQLILITAKWELFLRLRSLSCKPTEKETCVFYSDTYVATLLQGLGTFTYVQPQGHTCMQLLKHNTHNLSIVLRVDIVVVHTLPKFLYTC